MDDSLSSEGLRIIEICDEPFGGDIQFGSDIDDSEELTSSSLQKNQSNPTKIPTKTIFTESEQWSSEDDDMYVGSPLGFEAPMATLRPTLSRKAERLRQYLVNLQSTIDKILANSRISGIDDELPPAEDLVNRLQEEYRKMAGTLNQLESMLLGQQGETTHPNDSVGHDNVERGAAHAEDELGQLHSVVTDRDEVIRRLSERVQTLCQANDQLFMDFEAQEQILSTEMQTLREQLEAANAIIRRFDLNELEKAGSVTAGVSVMREAQEHINQLRSSLMERESQLKQLEYHVAQRAAINSVDIPILREIFHGTIGTLPFAGNLDISAIENEADVERVLCILRDQNNELQDIADKSKDSVSELRKSLNQENANIGQFFNSVTKISRAFMQKLRFRTDDRRGIRLNKVWIDLTNIELSNCSSEELTDVSNASLAFLKELFEYLEAELQNQTQRSSKMQKENEKSKQEMGSMKTRLSQLEAWNADSEDRIRQMEKDRDEEMEFAKTEHTNMIEKFEAQKDQVNRLKQELETVHSEKSQLVRDKQMLKDQFDRSSRRLQETENRNQQLREELARQQLQDVEAKKCISQFEENIVKERRASNELIGKTESLEKIITDMEESYEEVKSDLAKVMAQKKNIEQQLSDIRSQLSQIEALQDRLKDKERQEAALRHEIHLISEDMDDSRRRSSLKIEKLKNEINHMKSNLVTAKKDALNDSADLQDELRRLQSERDKYKMLSEAAAADYAEVVELTKIDRSNYVEKVDFDAVEEALSNLINTAKKSGCGINEDVRTEVTTSILQNDHLSDGMKSILVELHEILSEHANQGLGSLAPKGQETKIANMIVERTLRDAADVVKEPVSPPIYFSALPQTNDVYQDVSGQRSDISGSSIQTQVGSESSEFARLPSGAGFDHIGVDSVRVVSTSSMKLPSDKRSSEQIHCGYEDLATQMEETRSDQPSVDSGNSRPTPSVVEPPQIVKETCKLTTSKRKDESDGFDNSLQQYRDDRDAVFQTFEVHEKRLTDVECDFKEHCETQMKTIRQLRGVISHKNELLTNQSDQMESLISSFDSERSHLVTLINTLETRVQAVKEMDQTMAELRKQENVHLTTLEDVEESVLSNERVLQEQKMVGQMKSEYSQQIDLLEETTNTQEFQINQLKELVVTLHEEIVGLKGNLQSSEQRYGEILKNYLDPLTPSKKDKAEKADEKFQEEAEKEIQNSTEEEIQKEDKKNIRTSNSHIEVEDAGVKSGDILEMRSSYDRRAEVAFRERLDTHMEEIERDLQTSSGGESEESTEESDSLDEEVDKLCNEIYILKRVSSHASAALMSTLAKHTSSEELMNSPASETPPLSVMDGGGVQFDDVDPFLEEGASKDEKREHDILREFRTSVTSAPATVSNSGKNVLNIERKAESQGVDAADHPSSRYSIESSKRSELSSKLAEEKTTTTSTSSTSGTTSGSSSSGSSSTGSSSSESSSSDSSSSSSSSGSPENSSKVRSTDVENGSKSTSVKEIRTKVAGSNDNASSSSIEEIYSACETVGDDLFGPVSESERQLRIVKSECTKLSAEKVRLLSKLNHQDKTIKSLESEITQLNESLDSSSIRNVYSIKNIQTHWNKLKENWPRLEEVLQSLTMLNLSDSGDLERLEKDILYDLNLARQMVYESLCLADAEITGISEGFPVAQVGQIADVPKIAIQKTNWISDTLERFKPLKCLDSLEKKIEIANIKESYKSNLQNVSGQELEQLKTAMKIVDTWLELCDAMVTGVSSGENLSREMDEVRSIANLF